MVPGSKFTSRFFLPSSLLLFSSRHLGLHLSFRLLFRVFTLTGAARRLGPLGIRLIGTELQASLPCCLHVTLVVATNSIANSHKVKIFGVKDVIVLASHLKELFRQPIVVCLLLCRVVHVGVLQILVAIGNEEAFQLEE